MVQEQIKNTQFSAHFDEQGNATCHHNTSRDLQKPGAVVPISLDDKARVFQYPPSEWTLVDGKIGIKGIDDILAIIEPAVVAPPEPEAVAVKAPIDWRLLLSHMATAAAGAGLLAWLT